VNPVDTMRVQVRISSHPVTRANPALETRGYNIYGDGMYCTRGWDWFSEVLAAIPIQILGAMLTRLSPAPVVHLFCRKFDR